ncbi:hypothetical protein OIT44_03970 [Weissella ceti]|uniref:IrrE N-terminal-like domain-containing protein n=1 Tax=Weissella ceti TaxID=759620 RepID=A0ABT3E496_9LACO|nr:hypothetical protein [Weissella ceti]MCW0953231.1 hypothetical protein [Weissella ceti]QVK12747.1 hypothetical protein KHQ31_03730 [Weissella ceti]
MNKDELMNELVSSIKNRGVNFVGFDHLDAIAVVNPDRMIGAYDKNRATLFDVTHEFMHLELGHIERGNGYDFTNEQETTCNAVTTQYLWDMFLFHGGSIEYAQHFIEVSGCPDYWVDRIITPDVDLSWAFA